MVEHGLVRPCLVPPPAIKALWDLTRYLLDKSARAMLEALIAGERDTTVPPGLAKASMRAKRGILAEALTGNFTDHHAFLARTMLDRTDAITATQNPAQRSESPHRSSRSRGKSSCLSPFRRSVPAPPR